ncbi:MAG: hypothetical protein KDD04_07580, partial [Sinomicrobium sp.]|nr:hypothetical protein [Sinomicrobium sp.]
MRILWLNEYAEFIGGCEAYVHQTAKLLNEKSVESVLLYSVKSKVSSGFAAPYSRCFPAVDLEKQITALNPDL